MNEYNQLWGDVRSWAHGVYADDIERLSELESILEYAPVSPSSEPGLVEYLNGHLKALTPHAPEPRDPEMMRAWLAGQLLEVLGFMHDDPNIVRMPGQEDSAKHLRRLETHYANLEYDTWASTSVINGVVSVDHCQAVFDYLTDELEHESKSMLRVTERGYPERVDGWAYALDALEWVGVSEFVFSWERLSSGFGLNRQFSVRVRLTRESARLAVMGPARFPVGVAELLELFVQLSRRSARFAPQFVSGDDDAKESFEALWRCVRAIRTRR